GNWRVTTTTASSSSMFTVHLEEASGPATARGTALVRPAMACGSRTLFKSAGACVDLSQMPLTGQVIDGEEAQRSMKVDGELMVAGLSFTQGDLTIRVGCRSLHAQLSRDG